MARDRPYLFALNGGEVSPHALGRVDLARMRLTAETFTNIIPRVIGPAQFRPGWAYAQGVKDNAVARHIPFTFAADDTAQIELTDSVMRVAIAGTAITRPSVSSQVTNGNFSSSTGWTIVKSTGAVCDINSTDGGHLSFSTNARGSSASCTGSVTVAAPDQNVEHTLIIDVTIGPVLFRCGSTSGADDYIAETELLTGIHHLAFTPTGDFHVYFTVAKDIPKAKVTSCLVASSGVMEIATPWAAADLFELRYDQSGDVIFVTHPDHKPRRIERRAARSWSLTEYQFINGPWRSKSANVTFTPSALNGFITVTASAAFFRSDHVGSLFRMFTGSQDKVSNVIAGNDAYSDVMRITGYNSIDYDGDLMGESVNERRVIMSWTGSYVGTASLLTSDEEDGEYKEFEQRGSGYTNSSWDRYPGQAGSITYFKVGFQPGNYTSGSLTVTLTREGGGGWGVFLVTEYVSSTQVRGIVLSRLRSTSATATWEEGYFNDYRGWPAAIAFFEGRLFFGSRDKIFGSITDDYVNFDEDTEGDSGPIIRSLALGPVNDVRWLLALSRLCMGTTGSEPVARSSSFDEPISPTQFAVKNASTQGSADIQAVTIDKSGIYIQRSRGRAYELFYSVENNDYTSQDLTRYHPDMLAAGVKIVAVQRQPDTRVWFVLDDGTCAVLTYEKSEDVISWWRITTDGEIEDIAVTPNTDDDDVWAVVKRTVNGSTVRYRERLAYDHQAQGGVTNYMADSYVTATLSSSTTMTGLSHLEGEDVVVWANGSPILDAAGDPDTFTVSGGQITLPSSVTGTVIAGLAYTGTYKSTKLAYGAQLGTAVSQPKILNNFAPILYKTHSRSLKYGQSLDKLAYLPRVHNGVDRTLNYFFDDYDAPGLPIEGGWKTDNRLCLQFRAPLPATVLGLSFTVETHERP